MTWQAEIHITAATRAGRWRVVWRGETLIASCRDPEHAAARDLLARGVTGELRTNVNGTPSLTLDIETAAGLSTYETNKGFVVARWKPFSHPSHRPQDGQIEPARYPPTREHKTPPQSAPASISKCVDATQQIEEITHAGT